MGGTDVEHKLGIEIGVVVASFRELTSRK